MISTSQREHLTYTAIGQVLILVGAAVVIFTYITPWFWIIDTKLNAANAAIKEYNDTVTNWLSFEKLGSLLTSMKWKEELIAIINAAPAQDVRTVIKKEGAGDYLSWLKQAIASSDEDKKKLVQIKEKINSILPTLSPMSSNIDEENITLKQYIHFIEANILKAFNLDSNLALGLEGIAYGNGAWWVPKSIGTFDLSLDFKSTNSDIDKLITYINSSWNGDILNDSWSLASQDTPNIMSNPLITIESFSLDDSLDMTKPNAPNSWRTTIRFYVRWSSPDDLLFLAESVKSRWDTLKKKIDDAVYQCKGNTSLCGNLSDLEAFQLKYKDFALSISNQKAWPITNTIDSLTQQVISLRALEKEFTDLVPTSSTTN